MPNLARFQTVELKLQELKNYEKKVFKIKPVKFKFCFLPHEIFGLSNKTMHDKIGSIQTGIVVLLVLRIWRFYRKFVYINSRTTKYQFTGIKKLINLGQEMASARRTLFGLYMNSLCWHKLGWQILIKVQHKARKIKKEL